MNLLGYVIAFIIIFAIIDVYDQCNSGSETAIIPGANIVIICNR